ncbi:MAG: YeeE/YedE family protein [Aliihoeflea sp.]
MTPSPETMLWAAFAIGLVFGSVGQVSGFCLMSGLRGWWVEGKGLRIRAFALALAIAIVGSQFLDASGTVRLAGSLYMQPVLPVPLLLIGGALFGYGMVMANGCGARSLVLLGSGNLRSVLVLLCLGIAAQMTLTGLIAPWRAAGQSVLALPAPVSPPTLTALLGGWGLAEGLAHWFPVAIISGGLAVFAFIHAPFRAAPIHILGGLIVGLLVIAGWYATGVLGADDFDPAPLASLTFIAPIGDTIQYLMLATGVRLSFGVAVVTGVVIGAAVTALATRTARLQGFTRPGSMLRYMGGGALMGIGGALALGCSVGQGLTGLSTLAIGSFIAAAGVLAGAALGLLGPLRLPAPQP